MEVINGTFDPRTLAMLKAVLKRRPAFSRRIGAPRRCNWILRAASSIVRRKAASPRRNCALMHS